MLQGSDELTHGIDLDPVARSARTSNGSRAHSSKLNARRVDGDPLELATLDTDRDPVVELASDAGEIKIVLEPAGTRGYDDLRRRATREPIGEGLRPPSPTPATSSACSKPTAANTTAIVIETMQRAIELDRGLEIER